jgi:aminopeptidase N
LAEYFDRPADFKDFQAVAARASKRDLSSFFNEWIFSAKSSEFLQGNSSIGEIVQRYSEPPPKR